MKEFTVASRGQEDWIDITDRVNETLEALEVRAGVCVVCVPHTTAGVTIQENADPDVVTDCRMALERMAPDNLPYRHAEGNSPAHVKTLLTGSSATIPVVDGRLVLGTWQGVYLCEFDGPRRRRVLVEALTKD